MGVRVGVANYFLDQSIGIDETNTFRVGVAYSRNKLALRIRLRNLNLKSQFSIFDSFRDPRSYLRFFDVCGRFMGVRVGVANFFWVNRKVLMRTLHFS